MACEEKNVPGVGEENDRDGEGSDPGGVLVGVELADGRGHEVVDDQVHWENDADQQHSVSDGTFRQLDDNITFKHIQSRLLSSIKQNLVHKSDQMHIVQATLIRNSNEHRRAIEN